MAVWGPVDWSALLPQYDAENRLTGASHATLAAMSDCSLYGHPMCDGECPCGQVVRTTTTPESVPVTWHHEVSVWWAGVPRRQRRSRVKPARPPLPRVQQVVYP